MATMPQLVIATRPARTYVPPVSDQVGPRRQERVFEHVVTALDAIVLVIGFGLAYLIRSGMRYGALLPLADYLWVIAIAVPVWVGVARSHGLMSSQAYRSPMQAIGVTMKVH